jgi:putative flippase GtrA
VGIGCRFATGRGRLELGDGRRRPFDDDLGRRLIPFAIVGSVSTIVSLGLFVALRQSLGSVLAVVTALAATMVGNSWAHRRWTLGRRGRAGLGRHALVSGAVAIAGIGGSALALTSVGSAGGGLLAELVALAVVWSATTVLRLWLLSRHAG